jgi:hypothetical protein
MNENHNPIEIIQLLPKLVQALYSDGVLFFSGEATIATESRKSTLLNDINLIKEQIAHLEKILG